MELVPQGGQSRSAAESLLKNSALIWPAVSIGNVGQLCVDLLINTEKTFHLKKIGILTSKFVLPLVGYLGANSNQLTLALEVYHSSEWGITVVQQRTPVIIGKHDEFCEEVSQWIESIGFASVLVLASSPAYRRSDRQLQGDSPDAIFGFQASPLSSSLAKAIQKLDVGRIEPSLFSHLTQFFNEREQEKVDDILLPTIGTGFSRPLFLACQRRQIDTAIIYSFVNEGDNSFDGIMQADLLYRILSDTANKERSPESVHWKVPLEWQFVFGGKFDPKIYLQ